MTNQLKELIKSVTALPDDALPRIAAYVATIEKKLTDQFDEVTPELSAKLNHREADRTNWVPYDEVRKRLGFADAPRGRKATRTNGRKGRPLAR